MYVFPRANMRFFSFLVFNGLKSYNQWATLNLSNSYIYKKEDFKLMFLCKKFVSPIKSFYKMEEEEEDDDENSEEKLF